MADYDKKLYKLSELDDFKVASGDPDIRGWRLIDGHHDGLGEVRELIADPRAGRVRYLDVVLDKEFWKSDDERHVLIPIGMAHVDQDHDKVIVDKVDRESLLSSPDYRGEAITRDYEHGVIDKLSPGSKKSTADQEFYSSEHFNSDRFYGPRRTRVNVR